MAEATASSANQISFTPAQMPESNLIHDSLFEFPSKEEFFRSSHWFRNLYTVLSRNHHSIAEIACLLGWAEVPRLDLLQFLLCPSCWVL